jgi:hypothetical protein
MRCHSRRMHSPRVVIGTACTWQFWNNFEKWKSYAKRWLTLTRCMMHAVSFTLHEKYDTACTIDERIERPWQPLKGISIKNIYVTESSYTNPKEYIHLKGLPKKITKHARFLCSKIDHISANSKGFSPGSGVLFDVKNRRSKISWRWPFKTRQHFW